MKNLKKVLALVVAALLIAASVSALADTGSVTVSSPENGDTGSTYSLWKLFDIIDLGNEVYVYTPVEAYKDDIIAAVNTVVGEGTLTSESTNVQIQSAVAGITSAADKKSFADTLYGLIKDNDADITISAAEGEIAGTNDTVPIGYYLFGETIIGAYDGGDGVATRPMLYTVTTEGLTPTTKESYPTPSKTVTASVDGSVEDSDSATAQIGKDVTFVLKTTLPANFNDYNLGYKLAFNDTLSSGLKFNQVVSVTINGQPADEEAYDFVPPTWEEGNDTELTWTWDNIKEDDNAAAGVDVIITYKATVTGNAVIGSDGNPNTLTITYSNDPTSEGEGDSKEIEVKVYAFAINVNKTDDSGEGLAGAKFVLKKGNTYYKYTEGATNDLDTVTWVDSADDATVLVSKNDGTMYVEGDTDQAAATFRGLPEGTYVLHETEAPANYNVADDQTVEITASPVATDDTITIECTGAEWDGDEYVATTTVIDREGGVLPSTGGIGTTIFYIAGSILVLGAAILLITKRRMGAND